MFSPEEEDRELVSRIMLRPNADAIASEVQGRLLRERERRADFYAWLDEDRKAEFIEGEIVVHSPVRKRQADTTKWLTSLLDAYCTPVWGNTGSSTPTVSASNVTPCGKT